MHSQPSGRQPGAPTPLAQYAFRIWIVAILAFLVWLGINLAGNVPEPAGPTSPAAEVAAAKPDPGFIQTGLPGWGSLAAHTEGFEASQEYVLVGFGEQGFFQTSDNALPWAFSLPEQTVEAQLIRRSPNPQIVTEDIKIFWELESDTLLARPRTVQDSAGKDPAKSPEQPVIRRGEMKPPKDGSLSFSAVIPVSARRVDQSLNPYPLVTLKAVDAKTGEQIAQSAATLGVAPGFGCAHCHGDDPLSILQTHDRITQSSLRAQAADGQTVFCRSCHSGPVEPHGKVEAGYGLSVSAAIHGWHAQYLAGRDADACLTCHIGLGESKGPGGSTTTRPLFARDLHIERGLNCLTCHGAMEDHALALLKAEQAAGQKAAGPAMEKIKPRASARVSDINARLPWVQEPDCAACHDFSAKPRLGEVSGFNNWTVDEKSLFSKSSDLMDMVRCATCHGAPHAIYPAKNPLGPDRDNIPPMQYQQHARALGAAGNCAMCHTVSMEDSMHHPIVERHRTDITVPQGAQLTMPLVTRFSHEAHVAVECSTCHHTGRVDGVSMNCSSTGCHDSPTRYDAKGKNTGEHYFFKAFHGPYPSCYACHFQAQQAGNPAGPLACKDCHLTPSPRWSESGAATTDAQTPVWILSAR